MKNDFLTNQYIKKMKNTRSVLHTLFVQDCPMIFLIEYYLTWLSYYFLDKKYIMDTFEKEVMIKIWVI